MSIFDTLLRDVEIPAFASVRYEIKRGAITRADVPGAVAETVARRRVMDRVRPGDVVAIAAGSRGINNHDEIVRSVARELLARGAKPFIFPAMGSHGGATAEGQRDLLAGYGITGEAMGVPIVSSMETVQVGVTPHGLPVRIDAHAAAADWIVPVGRVKPHTDFRGRHESGLVKMLSIGCGKQYGANICHMQGFPHMARNIWEIAEAVLSTGKVLFGLAIIEDASHGTWSLTAVPGEAFDEEDAALLEEAKGLIPRIPFEKIDLLVLSEIGKDISGASMDPNITGRSAVMGSSRPFAERIVALDLTDASHHNATGVGNADITTRRLFEKMRFEDTYPNGITSHEVASMKIPPVLPDDRSALRMAIHTIVEGEPALGVRAVWLKNTLSMGGFLISENLIGQAENIPGLSVRQRGIQIAFDDQGNVSPGLERYFH